MELKLTNGEARELRSALDRRLQELMNEIAHTEDREFRAALRDTYERLERLQRRLLSATAA